MKIAAIILCVLLVMSGIGLCIAVGVIDYHFTRDLDALMNRASVAADAEDMLVYVEDLRLNMQKHNATTGYTAIFFERPDNSLDLTYQAVEQIKVRLSFVVGLPKDSTAYQAALDDLRGTLRELPRLAGGLEWVRFGQWFLWAWLALFVIFVGYMITYGLMTNWWW